MQAYDNITSHNIMYLISYSRYGSSLSHDISFVCSLAGAIAM